MTKKNFYLTPECWNIPVEQCDVLCQSFSTENLVLEDEKYQW